MAWNTRAGTLRRTFVGHRGELAALDVNYDGTLLLSAALDRKCLVWDMGTGKAVHTLK